MKVQFLLRPLILLTLKLEKNMATIALNSQKPLVVLESQNENTKIFNFNDKEIMLYISRAYDEESGRHFLTYDIPEIASLGVQKISDIKEFESEDVRDLLFKSIDERWVEIYIKKLVIHINQNSSKNRAEKENEITPHEEVNNDEQE
jgi:hypothetical protein